MKMKALLLKDWYMMWAYCRALLVIAGVFLVVSVFGDNNMFFVCYPIVVVSMIPHSLLSYDGREKWETYSGALPYTRTQIVEEKYVFGFLGAVVSSVLCTVFQLVRIGYTGTGEWRQIGVLAMVFLMLGILVPMLTLPFVFYFGAEKGRMVYMGGILLFCVICPTLLNIESPAQLLALKDSRVLAWALPAAVLVLYGVSCGISVLVYKKREI